MKKPPKSAPRRKDSLSGCDPVVLPGLSCLLLPAMPGGGLPAAFIAPGGSEFLLIMLVLILLFGAKDAPRIFRSIHNALDKMQRAAASFRYKIMYSDFYKDLADEELYDADADDPDEEEDPYALQMEPAEKETAPAEEENSEPETEASEPRA